jgi:Domain of unknown function (DUF4234)
VAEVVTIGTEQFKRRNLAAVWLGLPLITLGIYTVVWWYMINDEARRYLGDPTIKPVRSLLAMLIGWLIIVPPFVSIYRTGQRIQRMEAAARLPGQAEPVLGLLASFILSLHTLYFQSHLNRIWDAYLHPAVMATAEYGALPPPTAVPSPPPPAVPPTT